MITIDHVTKRWGRVRALDDVNLTISAGERVALVGTNGSGKTTLLRAMLGLVRVVGAIRIGGIDVALDPAGALRRVAYIPQIAPPIDAPVAEVVHAHARLRELRDDDVWAHARALGLDPAAARGKRFTELSGGMKQKLLAAMALAVPADVLIGDEPTANLDGHARAAFLALLDARPPSSVVVLCSHRSEEVDRLVQRIVRLADGRVVDDATQKEKAA